MGGQDKCLQDEDSILLPAGVYIQKNGHQMPMVKVLSATVHSEP